MFPRQPACSSLAVGSITTTSSARSGSRSSSGASADSAAGSSSRPKNRQRYGAPASASSIITATAPFMSLAPSPCTRPPSMRPGRLSWAGTVSRWPGEQDRGVLAARPGRTCRRGRARHAAVAQDASATCAASRASSRDSDGMSTSSSVRAARRSARARHGRHNSLVAVRYCGVDVSAKPGNQQLVTLHERRAADGAWSSWPPSTRPARRRRWPARSRASGAARRWSRSTRRPGPRLDLLAPGAPLRAALGLPDGRYERMRVCDALLFRRGLPLYPVPPAGQAPHGLGAVDRRRLRAVRRAGAPRPLPPGRRRRRRLGPVGRAALRFGRLCETYPDAVFCSLLGHRPPPKRTPWGAAAAHRRAADAGRRRTPTAGCGTARSTSSTPAPPPMPPTRSPRAAGCGSARPRRA